jgi:hypothetical protein
VLKYSSYLILNKNKNEVLSHLIYFGFLSSQTSYKKERGWTHPAGAGGRCCRCRASGDEVRASLGSDPFLSLLSSLPFLRNHRTQEESEGARVLCPHPHHASRIESEPGRGCCESPAVLGKATSPRLPPPLFDRGGGSGLLQLRLGLIWEANRLEFGSQMIRACVVGAVLARPRRF